MPAIIPAVIIGAGAIGGALISSHAASSASNAASTAAANNNALESQIYQSNKGLETPFINAGDAAETELSGFLGLGGDPAATQAAFQKYLDSTGYQFDYNQGLDAVAQSKAASGLLGSGSLVKALDAYGTGLAQQYGQQYVNNLEYETGVGANSANALAGQGQSYANAVSNNNNSVSNNNNSAASASGNASVASANSINGLIGNAFSAYGLARGGSSYGGGGSGTDYNAFAPGN
jgi:hypothetical protein